MIKPVSANLCNTNQFDFGSFIQNRCKVFIKRFTEEITEAFEQLDFWLSFIIFDLSKLPMGTEDFTESGVNLANQSGIEKLKLTV